MRKKLIVVTMAFILMFALAGCDMVGGLFGGKTSGKIGDEMKTEWFNFTVTSANEADSYAGYTPAAGKKLVVVDITETNTTDGDLEMGTFDFDLDDPADTEYYKRAIDPLDDTMMPESFTLASGETVSYTLVFEVEASSSGFSFLYTEYYVSSDGSEGTGDTFTIDLGF